MAFVYNPDPFAEPIRVEESSEYKIRTGKYTFLVRKTNDVISIGGKDKKCVQISTSAKKLMWLESDRVGKCEVNGLSIAGDSTIMLAQLAMTLLREYNPDITDLTFEDASSFSCIFPDGNSRPVSLNMRDALIYGHTYYERYFSAMSLEGGYLHQFRKNRLDPSKKMPFFDFNCKDLQQTLMPIYNTCVTWAEFMHKLYLQHGSRELCTKIHPWYKSAFYQLSGHSEPPFYWSLNVWQQPDVPYIKLDEIVGGSIAYWNSVRQPTQKAVFNGSGLYEMVFRRRYNKTLRKRN